MKGSIKNNTDLSNENTKTVATIDLGGASTQIAFKPQLPEMNYSYDYNVTLPENNDYTVYSISYLGYGNDQARNNVINLLNHDLLTVFIEIYKLTIRLKSKQSISIYFCFQNLRI